jgi:hypothetical protein
MHGAQTQFFAVGAGTLVKQIKSVDQCSFHGWLAQLLWFSKLI